MQANLSYREVIPRNLSPEEWIEVKINTGTQSTLEDIKTSEKAGGFCYKNLNHIQNRNRFIYWRTYQDVLELCEISLDLTLLRSNLRLHFTDSTVLNVSLSEQEHNVTILVVTVSSLHRFVFQMRDGTAIGNASSLGDGDSRTHSIFYDANAGLSDPSNSFVIDAHGTMPHNLPHAAVSHLSANGEAAYFAVAYQSRLMLHIMSCDTGATVTQEVKEPHLMPRFFSNIKGALTGRGEILEAAISMAFSHIDDAMYLLALYRNDELRLWSVNNIQNVCTMKCPGTSGGNRAQGPQNNLLRKIDEHNFCVFLSHETDAEFVCISVVCNTTDPNAKALELTVQHNVPAPRMDLADFDATTSHIWALWSNAKGEFHVSTIFLAAGHGIKWVSGALEPPPDRYSLTIEQGVDPREAFCSYIFHPGRFDRDVIAKALYMFRRINMRFDTKQLTMPMLKEQVCQAVEDELQNELKDFVVSDEEYLEIVSRLWNRFYSCCEQYHLKFSEPTGLAVLECLDAVCIVRRQSFALMRPCEMLEHLMLIGEYTGDVASFVAPYCINDRSVSVDFVELMKIVAQLEKLLSEDIKMELNKKLHQRESPIDVVRKLLAQDYDGEEDDFQLPVESANEMQQKLGKINGYEDAVYLLLDMLCIVDKDASLALDNSNLFSRSTRFLMSTGALFGSECGLSVLAETVKQMAMIRYAVCRNLLILQFIMHNQYGVNKPTVLANVNYLKSYYTLVWIAEMPISLNAPSNFEASIQRISRAQLFSGYTRPYVNKGRLHSHSTLLYLFLQSKGLFTSLSMLLGSTGYVEQPALRQTLLQLVGFVNQLLWPDATNDVFLEWLFGTCHHIIIQDYVRILNSWCTEKIYSRKFILAVSLLDCGESHKAVCLFAEAAPKVLMEPFLFEHVLKSTPLYDKLKDSIGQDVTVSSEDSKEAMVHLYLKVIQLFEQHSARDYIIELAQLAISNLNPDDPQLPMFQSIVFNNHLQLGHYLEAYHALMGNADISRRKDCLRQLVITLFQSKNLDMLMSFTYNGLTEEFESIVESRARSQSIDHNEVYNFLYAYHTSKDNMRKAATVMYEQAMRLQVDSDAPNALEKRCSSLLVCINSLHLVDKRYRWIARPTIGDEQAPPMEQDEPLDGSDEGVDSNKRNEEVMVLELEDIRRELLHAEALRELAQHRKVVGSSELVGAEELCYLLASCGLYTAAIKLARGHDLPMLPIFESLAAACVNTMEDKATDAWVWLQDNDLSDLPHRSNAADMAWGLLQKLAVDNELHESTVIRKCVVNRLLTLNAFLPQWLYDSYKLTNSRELLHLLVKHNRLLDASDLACEMISAMLGAGSEYFDFKHPLALTNPLLSFPVHTIDLLMHGLQVNSKIHIEYEMARVQLDEEIARYVKTVQRTTDDKIKFAILQERENRYQEIH